MNTLTLGCDPELFLQDAAGALRSSIGLIGGTKEAPMPLPLGDGFAVQEDNVALEFNIPPSASAAEFSNNIGTIMAFLERSVQERYGLAFSNLSSAVFPEDQLKNPAALVFGCDPDFNAWTLRENPRPQSPNKALRSCGGHVHIGYKFANPDKLIQTIRLCDMVLGVPSILQDVDGAPRRELYGKRGAFRQKPYGVEYRTLSNYWVGDPTKREWVFNNTQLAIQMMEDGFNVDALDEDIKAAIDGNDVNAAKKLVAAYNIPLA